MTALYETITPLRRFIITVAVITATLMQVIDTTIVNVALPHMQGTLNAAPDEISWVLTSYLVSSGIFMPLTGYLNDKIGMKKYLLLSVFGFVIASALCGLATSLSEIVSFRILQGVMGAALVPLSQAILITIYPESDRGKALALWGIGVMVGPVLGPTLGGYLTDIASWRWTFYINVPVGIICLLLIAYTLPTGEKKPRQMDWLGLLFLSLAIGFTQFVLDRGNQDDWFDSNVIIASTVIAILGLVSFILYSYFKRHKQIEVFDLKIFKDRNFAVSSILLGTFGLCLYGGMIILPLLAENLLNYPVLTTGLIMAPRGISAMISMLITGRLMKHTDARILIGIGILIAAAGSYIGTYYNFQITPFWIIWPLFLQGFGLGMILVPLTAIAFSTLSPIARVEAAGVFSLLRTIGSSIGISIVITVYTRHFQKAWNLLGGYITPYNHQIKTFLQSLHLTIHDKQGMAVLGREVARQAQMIAFVDSYALITGCTLLMLPLVFLLKRYKTVS